MFYLIAILPLFVLTLVLKSAFDSLEQDFVDFSDLENCSYSPEDTELDYNALLVLTYTDLICWTLILFFYLRSIVDSIPLNSKFYNKFQEKSDFDKCVVTFFTVGTVGIFLKQIIILPLIIGLSEKLSCFQGEEKFLKADVTVLLSLHVLFFALFWLTIIIFSCAFISGEYF